MTASRQPAGRYPDWSGLPGGAIAPPHPKNDPFYSYTGHPPLPDILPGTVLKTRSVRYHILGLPTVLETTQLLYRSTSQTRNPTVNVTSVIQPLELRDKTKVISYQSAYDSLKQDDEPSYAISGGHPTLGGVVPNVELGAFGPFLAEGYTVIVPDTEGQRADFAAGPEYGMNTLDSIRAAFNSSAIDSDAKVAMLGYSGGALATEWAAEFAPTYAPDVNKHLIGAAIGGVLVHPAHNLHYVEGSLSWAGVMPMALVGIARAFQIDFRRYLSDRGVQIYNDMQTASIVDVLGPRYAGLKWEQLAKPEYPTPESIPLYVTCANQLIMGTGGTPNIPLFIGQGAGGELEGTPGNQPGIGAGDGVMIAGDVRTLARDYCAKGTAVHYEEYDLLSHVWSLMLWLPNSIAWIKQRFANLPPPQNCSSIQQGNPIKPIPVP
ncbi:triacylglycerol lipase [Mycobacterium nebraskense]|uniref:lipase family protein n=1 Tax=Mycobacterium nebraskense TaxID=244292 RepID=UPI000641A862|nr:lipase family protein [Mycobacterium nebraskense]KLO34148.1 triacylglycerol lipase [Mycobacterium nebraskense]